MDSTAHPHRYAVSGRTATAPSPVDIGAVRRAVDRALSFGNVLPRPEEAESLFTELSGHVQRLLDAVPHAGRARAETAAAQAVAGPGPGLRSATERALLLALDCRWLLRYLTPEGRPAR